MALKEPAPFVITVAGTVTRVIPSNVIVIVEMLAKFWPVTVITKLFVFLLPVCGAMDIEGFTVKVVCAEFWLALSSVAIMSWFPGDDAGTVNDALNEPVGVVVIVAGEVAIIVESNFKAIMELGAKLDPDTETDEPTIPFEGVAIIDGIVTPKVADASAPESMADTVWLPTAETGMENDAEKVPVSDEVTVNGVVDTVVESNFMVIGE